METFWAVLSVGLVVGGLGLLAGTHKATPGMPRALPAWFPGPVAWVVPACFPDAWKGWEMG
jgi:hypothetical protein